MSDVTVVFLTLGEPYAERALESVRRQTLSADELVVVDGSVSPYHRAFNLGVSKVRTRFLCQVDADMVLDPICFEGLHACMADRVGIAFGRLRDPLIGRIGSVRLCRTSCFEHYGYPDTISPDTDFWEAMDSEGWGRVDALRWREGPRDLWHTFGEHRPDYTPLYTFSKFRIAGASYRYRRDPYTLRNLVRRLHASPHPAAPIALAAMTRGVFLADTRDQLRSYSPDAELEVAVRFCFPPDAPRTPPDLEKFVAEPPRQAFLNAFEEGARLRAGGDERAFLAAVAALAAAADRNWTALVALPGLCHGLLTTLSCEADAERAYAMLDGWLVGDGGRHDP
jgi:hypothetical protein